jgi:hypothetical protein
MGHYYGLDWISRLVIACAIVELGRRPRRAMYIFMVANVASVALALVACPVMWGTVVGDTVFALMHWRNLRSGRIAADTKAATKSAPMGICGQPVPSPCRSLDSLRCSSTPASVSKSAWWRIW